jgi:hypothetical protein
MAPTGRTEKSVGSALVPLPPFTQSRAIAGPSDHGFLSGGRRSAATCQWAAPNPERSGPGSIDIPHQFETGGDAIDRPGVTPALTARATAADAPGTTPVAGPVFDWHKIGPIELPNGLASAERSAYGGCLPVQLRRPAAARARSRQTAQRRPAPRQDGTLLRRSECRARRRSGDVLLRRPALPCSGSVIRLPACRVLCRHQNGLVSRLPRNWAVFARVSFTFHVSCTMPQPEFRW